MPELVVDIPKSFLQSTKDLVETVRKFTATAETLTKNIDTGKVRIQQVLPEAKFEQLARRLESMSSGLERDLHRITSMMGPLGQTFFRGMTFSETIITGIGRVAGIAGMAVIGAGVAAREGFSAIRYLWDKIVNLGDFMFQDYLISSGMQTTIGGLRAFRTAFFGLPLDPAMNMNFAISQVNTASRQMNALRILGVNNTVDNAEMMVQATLAAARFMKAQPKGNELLNAHYIGLTTLFSPEYLTALEKMNEEELNAAARKFEVNRTMLELSDKAVEGWKNFTLQIKIAGAQIESIIGERLADPKTGLAQAFRDLSVILVKLFRDIMNLPTTREIIDNATADFKAFAESLGGQNSKNRINNFTKQGNEFRDALKFVMEQLFRLEKSLGMTIKEPKEEKAPSVAGTHWQKKFLPQGVYPNGRPGAEPSHAAAPGAPGAPAPGARAPVTYGRPSAPTSPPVTFRKGVRTHPEKFAHDRDFSKDNTGKQLDPNVFAQAENIAKTGDVQGVYNFITSHGGHVDYNYCGDFVGAVVKAEGGKPPPGYPIATSWANYGTPVKPGEEKPGDIAIYMRGHRPGETGGHVGIVGSQGALGNGKFQFFGANNTTEHITSEEGVIFRRPPTVGPPPDPRSMHRYRPIVGQREQQPIGQQPNTPVTAPGRAPVELRPFSHPEDPLTTPPGWTPMSTEPGSGVRQFQRADVNNAIDHASSSSGISRDTLYAIAHIESGGNPDQRTGSYAGLFQLSESEFRKYGGQGSVYDPEENARVAALKLKAESDQVSQQLGRPLTDSETYLVHQQGVGAAPIHLTHPDQPAWQSMYQTAEGQQKGEAWAKRAIWGNLPADERARFGSVDNVTSGDFVSFWHRRFVEKGGQPGYGNGIPWQPPAQKGWPTSKEEDDRAEKAETEKQTGPNLISPIPGVNDFTINSSGVFGASRSGGGRLHSGNDLHGPTGSPAVSMNDGTVLYNGWNQGYNANIVIKGDDGVIRRYAVHGATEPLPVGSRVTQGQRIGTIGEGHIHYEEIPPTKDGQPNPVYQEMTNNPGRFVSTTQERGTVDPSGPQGTLQYIGRKSAPEVKKDVPNADKGERGVKAKPIAHLNAPFSAGGDEKARKAAEDHPVNKFAIKNQSDSDLAWMSNP